MEDLKGNLITIYYSIDYELSVHGIVKLSTNEMGKIKYGHYNNSKFCYKKTQQNFHIDTYLYETWAIKNFSNFPSRIVGIRPEQETS